MSDGGGKTLIEVAVSSREKKKGKGQIEYSEHLQKVFMLRGQIIGVVVEGFMESRCDKNDRKGKRFMDKQEDSISMK